MLRRAESAYSCCEKLAKHDEVHLPKIFGYLYSLSYLVKSFYNFISLHFDVADSVDSNQMLDVGSGSTLYVQAYDKCWDTINSYHSCPKIRVSPLMS